MIKEYKLSMTSMQNLSSCDVVLQRIIAEAARIIDIRVMCGHRNKADQDKAVQEKKSKLRWPNSKHNSLPSRAVDIAPWFNDKPNIDWNDALAFAKVAGVVMAVAKRQGVEIIWGGDWNDNGRTKDEIFLDLPHIELK